ncbi:MAG: DUF1800 domain-containing protein [Acidobacteriota bacterium]
MNDASLRLFATLLSGALVVVATAVAAPAVAAPAGTAPTGAAPTDAAVTMPWRDAGLTAEQAAAHLLDRFAHGARPGEVEAVAELGPEAWFTAQLRGVDDLDLDRRLAGFDALWMSTEELTQVYRRPALMLREAQEAGVVTDEELGAVLAGESDVRDMAGNRELRRWAREQGYKPQRELTGQLMTAKLMRAVYGENQVREVLTDFWFNHFNVSITDNEARPYVLTYERDAIAPFVLGSFRDMLEATAKHPAMLLYLDNMRSVAPEGTTTTLDSRLAALQRNNRFGRRGGRSADRARFGRDRGRIDGDSQRNERRPTGLNENYARELMELHTLGVDGGYDQEDVVEVARAFTGWAMIPHEVAERGDIERRLERARRYPSAGFVVEGDFVFRADVHDAEKKNVLGTKLPAGRGIEDGLQVLDILATHPSTARHLASKLAVRFVSEEPSAALVDRLAAVYLDADGEIEPVVRALVASPEFWASATRGAKIKSPFELAASAMRALDAELGDPRQILEAIRDMGQPLYAYQAPTGYPDKAAHWVNTGSLLARMNFGLALAGGTIQGVTVDLDVLTGGREPESLEDALETWVPRLLPERDAAATVDRLLPLALDPQMAIKVANATPERTRDLELEALLPGEVIVAEPDVPLTPSAIARVVGLVIGSPEFQRR